jgi:tetratricopeptide (TPR) repeat protein
MALKRDVIIQNAEKLVTKGKIEAAIKEYVKLVEDNPKDTNILNRIGDLYSRIHRIKDAVKYYREVAKIWAEDGFYLKAIAMLRKANKYDPSVLEIYSELGDLCVKQGMPSEAVTYYQYLAEYYTKNNQNKEAAEIYAKLVQMAPDNIIVRGKLAEIYAQTGEVEKALSEFQAIGKMLISKGRVQEAIQVYNRALKLDPDNLEMVLDLANSLKEEGKFSDVIKLLENAISSGSNDPRVYLLSAEAYMQNKNYELALDAITIGLRKSPDNEELFVLKGEILSRQERIEDAVVAFHQAADIAFKKKDTQKALGILYKILKKDPVNIPTLQKLVYFNETLKQETHLVQSLSMLAEAYAHFKLFSEATQTLEKLVQLEPDNAQHKEKLAYFKQKMGKRVTIEELSMPEVAKEEIEELPEIELPVLEKEEVPQMEEEKILTEEELPQELKEYINEHLVEVDVFFKYNLMDKAIQGLQTILERVPNYIPCLEKLLQIYLEDGKLEEAEKIGGKLMELYENKNLKDKLENLKEQLLIQGISIKEEGGPQIISEEVETPVPADTLVDVSAGIKKEELPQEEYEIEIEPEFEPAIEMEEEAAEKKEEIPIMEEELPKIEEEKILTTEEEFKIEFEEIEPTFEKPQEEIKTKEIKEEIPKKKEKPKFEPEISLKDILGEKTKEKPKIEKEKKIEIPKLEDLEKELKKPEVKPKEVKEIQVPSQPMKKKEPAKAEKLLSDLDSIVKKEKIKAPTPTVEIKQKPAKEERPQGLSDFLSLEEEIGGIIEEKKVPSNEPPVELLGELDFYMEQEIMDEAEKIIKDLKTRFPDHPETLKRVKKYEDLMSSLKEKPLPKPEISDGESLFSEEEEFFDLATELEEELKEEKKEVTIPSQEEPTLEEVFEQFKAGVQQTLSPEDYDTHYNLGIAYKEMGLIDEAIAEFQIACKDPLKLIDCCSMLGLCFQEKGMPQLAEKWYKKALDFPEITQEAQLGILYDLANLHLQTGDIEKAYNTFMDIYSIDTQYRDVQEKIKELEKVFKGVH